LPALAIGLPALAIGLPTLFQVAERYLPWPAHSQLKLAPRTIKHWVFLAFCFLWW